MDLCCHVKSPNRTVCYLGHRLSTNSNTSRLKAPVETGAVIEPYPFFKTQAAATVSNCHGSTGPPKYGLKNIGWITLLNRPTQPLADAVDPVVSP